MWLGRSAKYGPMQTRRPEPMRIFVTGGTGFIGSHFLAAAMAAGHEVVALKRPGAEPRIPLQNTPIWCEGNLSDEWRRELEACDSFVHLAAYGVSTGSDDWEGCFQTNVIDSIYLWRKAISAGVERFVIIGSCFEYGRSGELYESIPVSASLLPTTAYSASKAAATMAAFALAIQHNTETIIARPFHAYGDGEDPARFWPTLRTKAQSGEDLSMTAGEQVRDFTPVSLVAAEILKMSDPTLHEVNKGIPEVVNIGSGKPKSLREFAEEQWTELDAQGTLLVGALNYRPNEVMRYVPEVARP
jgi:nucleoside-diphosphate-sugar epimerase